MSSTEKIKLKLKPKDVSTNPKLRVLDLFCGCGGFSQGLVQSGLDVVCGIDKWDVAIDTYTTNQSHKGLVKDLTQYSPSDFTNETGYRTGEIDIIVGGVPCQGFSLGGRRDKNDPRNSLFMEFVKFLDEFKPKAFLMENVVGILSMKTANDEKCLDIIMSNLTRDYNCEYYKLVASDFDVPQKRIRVIFIGFRKDLGIFPDKPESVTTDETRVAVKNVIIPQYLVDKKYYLSQIAIDGINAKREKMKAKGFGFGAQFLNLDKPSYTIPARYYKDGYDALIKYSDIQIRRLTEQELQAIQTFPPTYKFKGSRKDVIMQIGNAVACQFAYHLGKYLINKLK